MNTTTPSFGEWLVDRLGERGMRQYQLAELVGTSAGAVSSWVNNTKKPNRRSCWAIADALGIPRQEALDAAGYTVARDKFDFDFPDVPTEEEQVDQEFDRVISLAARNHHRLSTEMKKAMTAFLMSALYNAPAKSPDDVDAPDEDGSDVPGDQS